MFSGGDSSCRALFATGFGALGEEDGSTAPASFTTNGVEGFSVLILGGASAITFDSVTVDTGLAGVIDT